MHPEEEKKIRGETDAKDSAIGLPDELNPDYLFVRTHRDLLSQIAKGSLRIRKLAYKELRRRGLDRDGLFTGYEPER